MAHLILEVCRRHWRWIALSLAFWIAVSIHFRSDIYFFSDIARDFLLVEEVAFRHDIALIGARASIPGVFHGPAWTYLHVPLAVLSEGNPMAVHTFWFFLVLSSVILATVVAQRWFDHFAAWLVAVLLFLRLPLQSSALLNPFGATFGVIGLFWSWIEYTRYQNWRWLAAAFLCVGITIQFQMALGGPLLLLLAGAAAWKIVKTRQWKHVLSTVFLALPLSTFALFELKHGFPQVRGVLAFVSGAEDHGKMALFNLLQNRAIGVVTGHGLLEQLPPAALALIGLFFLWTLALLWKRGHELEKKISWWYLYFYGGFWLFSLLYGGVVWNFYYGPLAALSIIVFSAGVRVWPRKIWMMLVVFLVLLQSIPVFAQLGKRDFTGQDLASWQFYRQMAYNVFVDAPEEFGYYAYTADQYGYPAKYAMHYIDRLVGEKQAVGYEKRPVTYLLIAPNPDNPTTNAGAWKRDQVRIEAEPTRVWQYENGFRVERYDLSAEELSIPDDPLLPDSLQLR